MTHSCSRDRPTDRTARRLDPPGPSPRRAVLLLILRTIERIKRESPKLQLRALKKSSGTIGSPTRIIYLPRLLTVCKVGGRFASRRGPLPLLRSEVLRVPPVLAWPGLLFQRVPTPGELRVHREAQRRYRQTQKGKKAHRQAENRHRHELSHHLKKRWMTSLQGDRHAVL